jgi:hypothetical protein
MTYSRRRRLQLIRRFENHLEDLEDMYQQYGEFDQDMIDSYRNTIRILTRLRREERDYLESLRRLQILREVSM